jgi:hypothetical protein
MKTCTKCGVSKDDSEFYSIQRKDRTKPQLYRHCKPCAAIAKAENKQYGRDWELKKKYGITLKEYQQECLTRDNTCDICSNKVDSLHVDHNHTTGKVRGYLCGSCNRAIGLLKDSSTVCFNAAKYLETRGEG